MVGTSSGIAPSPRNCSDSAPACRFVRGTSTRQPNSGLVSYQDSASRCLTTSPITVTTGPDSFAARTSAATRSSVEATVRCSVVVPPAVSSTGVTGLRPAAINALAISPIDPSALASTRVVCGSACWVQSGPLAASTMLTSCTAREVSGTPAYSGTAVSAGTPGTISKGMCALAQAAASSASEPSSAGSPSNSRTTRLPCLAASTSSLARAAYASGSPLWLVPPSTISAAGFKKRASHVPGAWSSSTTASAARNSSTARTVSSCGSPGPAPTRATVPTGFFFIVDLELTWDAPASDRPRPRRAVRPLAGGQVRRRRWGDRCRTFVRSPSHPPRPPPRAGRARAPSRFRSARHRHRPAPSSRPRAWPAAPARQSPLPDLPSGQVRPGWPPPRPRRSSAGRRGGSSVGRRGGTGAGSRGEITRCRVQALHRERTLTRRRQHDRQIEHLAGLVEAAEALQTGPGQHDRVQLALGEVADPGVHVAANRDHVQAETERVQLRRTAGRAGAHSGTGRQVGELASVPADQDVPRVGPKRYRRYHQAGCRGGGKVLVRVHGQVDPAGQQRVPQRADEHAGSADPGQRFAGHVALRGDLDKLHRVAGPDPDRVGDQPGLGQRERARPSTKPQHAGLPPESAHSVPSSTTSARLTASTRARSRSNSSRNASA